MSKFSGIPLTSAAVVLLGCLLFLAWPETEEPVLRVSAPVRIAAIQAVPAQPPAAAVAPLALEPLPQDAVAPMPFLPEAPLSPEAYAVPLEKHRDMRRFNNSGDFSFIALVMDDCGISERGTRGALGLPQEVTLSFLPYGHYTASLARAAHAEGHDIMLHMPMQPLGKDDPGPDALIAGLSPQEVGRRVRAGFAAVPQAVGLNNHMGSRFTESAAALAPVMAEIGQRRLFFLDSVTSAHSAGVAAARKAGVPVLARDVFLDDTITEAAITRELVRAETIARKRGSAIVIGHPHPVTLRVLQLWLPGLEQRGFRLVKLRKLLAQHQSN